MKYSLPKKIIYSIIVAVLLVGLVLTAFFGLNGKGYGSTYDIDLGLDLAGGVSITYQVKGDETPSAEDMKDTVYKLQKRVEGYSTEAEVYQEGKDRINIEIPGVTDANKILDELGKPGTLSFAVQKQVKVKKNGKTTTQTTLDTVLTGQNVKKAKAVTNQNQTTGKKEYLVALEFDAKGTKAFAKATKANIGKPIYIIYDNQVISAPNVQEAITKGECTIDGMESYEAAENLASSIRIGSLPVKLNELRSNVVSAKLGVNAIQTTVKAGVIGFVLVCLIMIAFYAVPGVIACVALAIYMLMMLLALNGFNATLTLPGLAGIILGIGMAVDANVIIYARIQEEIGAGKSTGAAIKSGFGKAASAIIDGNVTTLIAAVVLYIKGSGTVMGFAQTLAIGIILSMFTAIFVTRWILYAFVGLGLDDVKFYGTQKTRKPINFVGNIKKYAIISGCLLLLCIGGLVMNMVKMGQPLNYSLEFLGGSSTSITFTDYKGEGFDASGNASADFKNEVTDVVKTAADVSEAELSDVSGEKTLIVRTPAFTEDQQKKVISTVVEKYGVSDKSIEVETISASVSNEMRMDAIVAVLIAAVGMLIYIWIRFKNLAFGASSVIALLHDVMVVLMVYAIGSASITVGSTFIACMLTIVGYSINATIVVFDRVRENRKKLGNTDLAEIVNTSITETLSRSFNTSITTLVMVLCLAVLGVDSIRQFAVPMMAGIISGCYSSVCLAGTIWYFMNRSAQKKAKAKKAGNKKK